jgi:tripartite-type tricarboxylate transporter receptor subunit TctC
MWGQGVVIENQAGAGGNIGAGIVAKAAPDGYTLLMMGINHVINPSLYKEVPYDALRDFRPIARVAVAPLAIRRQSEVPAELDSRADRLCQGTSRRRAVRIRRQRQRHASVVRAAQVADRHPDDARAVQSIAPMVTDLLGGQIPLGSPAAASALQHVKVGTLKVLAITSLKRSSVFPDVPTVAEAGITGYDVSAWNGLLAPRRRTPRRHRRQDLRRRRQGRAIEGLRRDPASAGARSRSSGTHAIRAFVASELDKWSKLVKESGAKLD